MYVYIDFNKYTGLPTASAVSALQFYQLKFNFEPKFRAIHHVVEFSKDETARSLYRNEFIAYAKFITGMGKYM